MLRERIAAAALAKQLTHMFTLVLEIYVGTLHVPLTLQPRLAA